MEILDVNFRIILVYFEDEEVMCESNDEKYILPLLDKYNLEAEPNETFRLEKWIRVL